MNSFKISLTLTGLLLCSNSILANPLSFANEIIDTQIIDSQEANITDISRDSSPPLIGPLTQILQRWVVSLNGPWQFTLPQSRLAATVSSSFKAPFVVMVPHTYNIEDGLEEYAGTAIYSRELPVDSSLKVNVCAFTLTVYIMTPKYL